MRAIGFTPGQVRASVAVRTGLQMAVAVVIGVPVGLIAGRMMLDGVTRSVGIGPGLAPLPALGPVALSVASLVGVAIVIGLMSARSAVHGEVADILREE